MTNLILNISLAGAAGFLSPFWRLKKINFYENISTLGLDFVTLSNSSPLYGVKSCKNF
jgi:hypothetical protein